MFFKNRIDDIKAHNEDFFKYKSIEQICSKLNFTLDEFIEFYKQHKTSIITYCPSTRPVFKPNAKSLTLDSKLKNISIQFLIHLVNGFPLK